MPTEWQPDLVGPLIGGMNAGVDPELVPDLQCSFGRNISVRGGRAHSRPRVIKRATLPSGKIQGASAFRDRNVVLIAIEGRIHEMSPSDFSLLEKTSSTDCNNPNRPRVFMCETVGSIAIQDGQSTPIIYDGDQFRRADETKDELPVGWMMNYSNGRLCVVVDNQRAVRVGDIKGDAHQSEFKFTEATMLLGGGDLFFPSKVTSLASIPVIDTSSGQGTTLVGCRDRVFSLKTQVTSRDLWPDVGFQTDFFPSTGVVGDNAVAAVNQDLYFRSGDGLRSIRAAIGDYSSPGLAPISREVGYRFDHDGGELLTDATVVRFDNRLLATHSPICYGNRSIALGLIAYNLDPLSTSGQKSPPVYDGEWDLGVQIAEIVSSGFFGRDRCFVIGRDSTGNGVWEILREADSVAGVSENPVQEVITRTLPGAGINARKQLMRADLFVSDITTDATFTLYFRSDRYPHWTEWDSFTVPASRGTGWGATKPVFRSPLSSRTPPEVFDSRTGNYLHHGFGFQVRLVWTGKARINFIEVHSKPIQRAGVADNTENQTQTVYADAPAGQESPSFWFQFTHSPLP